MRRLLKANFARLTRDRVFWSSVAFMLLLGAYVVFQRIVNEPDEPIDTVFFAHTLALPFLLAAFSALFIGTDYNDGTLRNKIIAGHSRENIYLANLVTCVAAGLMMSAANLAVVAAVGIPVLGLDAANLLRMALTLLLWILNLAAFAGIFSLVGMMIKNKSSAAVAILIGLVALFALAVLFNMRLDAPEFLDGYVFTDSLGNTITDRTPNPAYMTGMPRTISEIIFDVLPAGQVIQLTQMEPANPLRMALCSVAIIICSTAAGVWAFRKKDVV